MSLSPATTQYLDVPGGRLAYDDAGVGPLVICIPGLGDVRASYRFLVPALVGAGYRVVTMDLRGHGESSVGWPDYASTAIAGDVLALIHSLAAGPAVLIGNSYGGAAVAYAAATDPAAVAGVVLLDAFVRDTPQSPMQRMLVRTSVWAMGLLGAGAWISYYKSLYRSAPPADLAPYAKALTANLKQRGRFAAVLAMMHGSHAAITPRLSDLHAPVLIVVGSRDPDFPDPAAEARFIEAHLTGTPQKHVAIIEGAGHYPHAEMPDKTIPILLDFLPLTRGQHRGA